MNDTPVRLLMLSGRKNINKEVSVMAENIRENTDNNSMSQRNLYDFENHSFVVESVFKENDAETFDLILLRIMTNTE